MLLGQEKGTCRVTDEKEGCVAAAVSALCALFMSLRFLDGKKSRCQAY